MSARTTGPWWLHSEYSTIYIEGHARDSRVIQEVAAIGPKEGGRVQQEADAFLIVAAPELQTALSEILDRYVGLVNSGDAGNWDPETEPEVIAARAAIRKAAGRAA